MDGSSEIIEKELAHVGSVRRSYDRNKRKIKIKE
jgi:hypothetical protein